MFPCHFGVYSVRVKTADGRIFQFAENESFVRLEHHEYPNASIGTKFLPGDRPGLLGDIELTTLQAVFERFQGVKSAEIVQVSHEEEAWEKNVATHSIISYLDSYLLKALE